MVYLYPLVTEEGGANLSTEGCSAWVQWIHEVKGHPSREQWLNSFKKIFDTRVPEKSLRKMFEDLYNTCRECLKGRRDRPGDRGLIGALPILHMGTLLTDPAARSTTMP